MPPARSARSVSAIASSRDRAYSTGAPPAAAAALAAAGAAAAPALAAARPEAANGGGGGAAAAAAPARAPGASAFSSAGGTPRVSTMLRRPGSGRWRSGMLSHVLRPMMTALRLAGSDVALVSALK